MPVHLRDEFLNLEQVTIERLDHIGVVVEDLEGAIEFFVELGLELHGEGAVEGDWVDRVVGLEGVRADIAMLATPDGQRVELSRFHAPEVGVADRGASANAVGIRHIAFGVTDIDAMVAGARERGIELVGELERYDDRFRLCYVRGPEGIIVELAERLG